MAFEKEVNFASLACFVQSLSHKFKPTTKLRNKYICCICYCASKKSWDNAPRPFVDGLWVNGRHIGTR